MDNLQARLQIGDKSALKEIFEAHYTFVCAAIFRLVNEKNLTEDLAQQVFIRFWEKRSDIVISTSLGAYLRRMAVNEALAWLRTKKNRTPEELTTQHFIASATNAEDAFLHDELKEQIRLTILTLPPRCRVVFQLSRFEELTYQEISEQMDISIKTVENQMGKALRLLRERLQPYLSEV